MRVNYKNQFQLGSQMQSYLQELMNFSNKQTPTLDKIRQTLKNLQEDNSTKEKQLHFYEQKISLLPIEIRQKIQHQQYLQEQHELFSNVRQTIEQNDQAQASSPHNPNPFTSIVDKNLLLQKLINLSEEQSQIDYVARLSDMYIRCLRDQETSITMRKDKTTQELHELQQISQFIEAIKPYRQEFTDNHDTQQYHLVNDLIQNLKLHTSKRLTEKCENLVHYGPSGNNQKIIVQKYLIKNCKSIILSNANNTQNNNNNSTQTNNRKDLKIVTKFIEKILGDVIYYDVSYQKIVIMEVRAESQNTQQNSHQQVINRQKVFFFPSETQTHFQSIKFTLSYHIEKVNELKSLLSPEQPKQFQQMFDKAVERHISLIKSNLEYVLPYINIKSRKIIMAVLADGKDEVIEFEDLVLRLKFKGQDGDMFMNNLDAVFGRLLQVSGKQQEQENGQGQTIRFNDKNFQTLTNFFELGIFQAEQSLLQTSSKAIKKLTTNFTSRNNFQNPTSSSSRVTSKKLFNMIFFSVSNLIERFDQLLDKQGDKFGRYSKGLGMSYEEKASEWVDKLIEIREGVRKRIHEE